MTAVTFEAGTELLVDSETLTPAATWADTASTGSDVFRQGDLVTVVLRITNKPRAAWEKKKYKKGELATEGGNIYEAAVAETDEEKPTAKPADWTKIGPEKLAATLGPDYRPASTVKNETGTVQVTSAGLVEALDTVSIEAGHVYEIHYRAATVSP